MVKLFHPIGALKTEKAIPYLIKLLELSYRIEFQGNKFDSLNSIALQGLYNIALNNNERVIQKIKENINKVIAKLRKQYKDVKFLHHTIERMESQFLMNKAHSYTVPQVIQKLKVLESQ